MRLASPTPRPALLCWFGLLPLVACGASSPTTVAVPTAPLQVVAIDNPARASLVASCADLSIGEVALGDAVELRSNLPLGRWRVRATLGERSWDLPLPLPAAAARPDVVRLPIAAPPTPRPGFAWIPPGPALVGDILGVGQEDERPARVLAVDGFWMAVAETTNAEFAAFLNDVRDVPADWIALDSRKCRLHRERDGRFSTDAPELPVVTVTLDGARAYCDWRTAETGLRHRLPTEIEWEKAARGPESWTYAYGDVYRQEAANQASGELRPVGRHGAHAFGLCDMTGNAFEWVADVYRADAYSNPPEAGRPDTVYQSLRGGSFMLDGIFLRNSMRMKLRRGVRADDVGFRVLVEPQEFP